MAKCQTTLQLLSNTKSQFNFHPSWKIPQRHPILWLKRLKWNTISKTRIVCSRYTPKMIKMNISWIFCPLNKESQIYRKRAWNLIHRSYRNYTYNISLKGSFLWRPLWSKSQKTNCRHFRMLLTSKKIQQTNKSKAKFIIAPNLKTRSLLIHLVLLKLFSWRDPKKKVRVKIIRLTLLTSPRQQANLHQRLKNLLKNRFHNLKLQKKCSKVKALFWRGNSLISRQSYLTIQI